MKCIQCGWTIAERNLEVVTLGDGREVCLHRGGCPRPDISDRQVGNPLERR